MKNFVMSLAIVLIGTSALACMDGHELSLRIQGYDAATLDKSAKRISTDSGIRVAYIGFCGDSKIPQNMTKMETDIGAFISLGRDICLGLTDLEKIVKFRITYQQLTLIAKSGTCGGTVAGAE